MASYRFATPYVFWTQVNNYKEINEQVLAQIAATHGNEKTGWSLCDTVTSVNNTLEYNNFLQDPLYLKNILWDPLDQMIEECFDVWGNSSIQPVSYRVSNCWYNIYQKGDHQEIHDHSGSAYDDKDDGYAWMPAYSVAYVVKAGGKNSTVFTNKQYCPGVPGCTRMNFDTGEKEDIGEGTVMMFPSYLDHFVLPSNIDGRVTLTYNIVAKYPPLK